MPEINETWIREQMQAARVKVGAGNAVLKLLETWSKLKLSDNACKEAIDIFSKLALSHSLTPDDPEEVWDDARPGFIFVGDIIRVKNTAFDGEAGQLHNGRRGKVVAVRYGDIIMKSTDDKVPVIDGAHYSPFHLQKKVR